MIVCGYSCCAIGECGRPLGQSEGCSIDTVHLPCDLRCSVLLPHWIPDWNGGLMRVHRQRDWFREILIDLTIFTIITSAAAVWLQVVLGHN